MIWQYIIEVSLYIDIWRYRDNREGLSDREYIARRHRGRQTSPHYTKYTLIQFRLWVSRTLAELPLIRRTCVVRHAHLPSVHRSTPLVWVIIAGYPFISSHTPSIPLEPEWLFLKKALRMICDVWQGVADVQYDF